MPTLTDEILALVHSSPGLTDREITNRLRGASAAQQPINQTARNLEARGLVARTRRPDGLIGNFPAGTQPPPTKFIAAVTKNHDVDALSEDEIKEALRTWLSRLGWSTEIAWERQQGIDVEARRGNDRWIIEVKGPGSRQQMRVNYFIGILGETLQRMSDPSAYYSIALPDLPQYRGLWERLPKVAKQRTRISMLFVSTDGRVEELA